MGFLAPCEFFDEVCKLGVDLFESQSKKSKKWDKETKFKYLMETINSIDGFNWFVFALDALFENESSMSIECCQQFVLKMSEHLDIVHETKEFSTFCKSCDTVKMLRTLRFNDCITSMY